MEILNVGIPELLFILILMLILLGPEGMSKTARTAAREIRKIIRSPLWSELMKTQRDIQDLPQRLVREAGIDDLSKEVQQIKQDVNQKIQPPGSVHITGSAVNQVLPASDDTSELDSDQTPTENQPGTPGIDPSNQPEPSTHYPQTIEDPSTAQENPAEDRP
jgi:Sec-independent protein translocase protein TatA